MKNLIKKLSGMTLALLLVATVTVPVLAADSVTTGSDSISASDVKAVTVTEAKTIVNGQEVALAMAELTDQAVVEEIKELKVADLINAQSKDNVKVEAGEIAVQLDTKEVYAPAGMTAEEIAEKGVDVTFAISNVAANDKIKVLHKKASGEWEVLASEVLGAGMVKATFYSFSPVVFVRIQENPNAVQPEEPTTPNVAPANTAEVNNTTPATTNTTAAADESSSSSSKSTATTTTTTAATTTTQVVTSPKTGTPVAASVFGMVAVLSAAGLALVAKKRV